MSVTDEQIEPTNRMRCTLSRRCDASAAPKSGPADGAIRKARAGCSLAKTRLARDGLLSRAGSLRPKVRKTTAMVVLFNDVELSHVVVVRIVVVVLGLYAMNEVAERFAADALGRYTSRGSSEPTCLSSGRCHHPRTSCFAHSCYRRVTWAT